MGAREVTPQEAPEPHGAIDRICALADMRLHLAPRSSGTRCRGHLLCSMIGFRNPEGRALALVHLYKRGTFYPFAPATGGGEKRDNQLELQVRAVLGDDLRVEGDLARWFPVWGAPGL